MTILEFTGVVLIVLLRRRTSRIAHRPGWWCRPRAPAHHLLPRGHPLRHRSVTRLRDRDLLRRRRLVCERRILQHSHRHVWKSRPRLGRRSEPFLATRIPTSALAIIFGAVLLYSAYLSRKPRPLDQRNLPPDPLATRLRMNGSFPDLDGPRSYNVQHVPTGFSLMFGAGALSGLLGIGSGAVKVLAMDQAMRIPFKVSTTTSNFMIGVTAAASAGVYLSRGYVDPGLAMPVMLGVLAGSLLGSRILVKAETKSLRLVFSVVILVLGLQMLYNGFWGKI